MTKIVVAKLLLFIFFILISITSSSDVLAIIKNNNIDLGSPQGFGFGDVNSLGEGLTRLIIPSFAIALIAVFFYFVIGAFKFLTSGGDKNAVQSGRDMITHAVIGFILLIVWFLIIQFIPGALGLTGFKIL